MLEILRVVFKAFSATDPIRSKIGLVVWDLRGTPLALDELNGSFTSLARCDLGATVHALLMTRAQEVLTLAALRRAALRSVLAHLRVNATVLYAISEINLQHQEVELFLGTYVSGDEELHKRLTDEL